MKLGLVCALLVLVALQCTAKEDKGDEIKFRRRTRPIVNDNFNKTKYASKTKNVTAEKHEDNDEEKPSKGKKGVMGINMHIIGGRQASRGMFPWQASITIDQESFCGGSLITPLHVMSAAHCVDKTRSLQVVLGAQNKKYREMGRVTMQTRKKMTHPDWNSRTLRGDMSLIFLPRRVNTNPYISIVRLPSSEDASVDYTGEQVTVSGWGKTRDRSRFVSDALYFTQLTVADHADCEELYGSSSFHDTNICAAGDYNRATCQGDSGGPLVYMENDGEFTQVGIVSYGAAAGCGKGYPDVFTKVAAYVEWIAARTSGSSAYSSYSNFYRY